MSLTFASVVSGPVVQAELVGERPNIILVMTDDQGYATIGRHGHPWLQTPALDQLHDQSIRFTNFHVSPTSSPTRAALLSGRHPMRNGVTHTIAMRDRMSLETVTLAQVLQNAGYATGIFGKWHLGDEDVYQPHNRGFEEVLVHGGGSIGRDETFPGSGADVPGNKYFNPILRHNGMLVQTRGYCTDVFFDAAMGWMKQKQDKGEPFFLYLATNAAHSPYIAPERNQQKYESLGFGKKSAGFYGMIENIDENIGRLIARLEELNLDEDTVLIFATDNGMANGGCGIKVKNGVLGNDQDGNDMRFYNANMRGTKATPHLGGIRSPFFVRWPGKINAGYDIDRMVAHIDVFPTLAAIADAELPEHQIEGRSMLPLWEDANASWGERVLYTHNARWDINENPDDYQWRNVTIWSERFCLFNGNELFDMKNDPSQTTDVASTYPDLVHAMRESYEAWWKVTRPMMVNESAVMPKSRPYIELYEMQKTTIGIPEWSSDDY
ncbi:arylsulfatase [Planctomycetota bacterium]|nr:arylsulfatase [Planctomycetota bacterium]